MPNRLFNLDQHKSTVRREVLAGVTTFVTMAYILFVQPAILSVDYDGNPTGLDHDAVLLATCISACVATLIMGLYARYPIALAPGMGQNFFFVSALMSLRLTYGDDAWRVTLGVVFVAGVLFLLLSLLGVREAILAALSSSMRHSIAVGIGIFIAFIGLVNGGLIVDSSGTFVKLNDDLFTPKAAVFWTGLLVTVVAYVRGVRGAILMGIVAATGMAAATGQLSWPERVVGLPNIEQSAILEMDIAAALSWVCLPYICIFLFMDLFDTIGTLIGVAEQAGFVRNNELPRAKRALTADAVGTVAGACLGTSTVTSYIESIAGVEQGGRTGLTSVTVAVLFLVALLFSPLIGVVSGHPAITAPALVMVGSMMARNVTKIDWPDASESVPAFLVMLGIPLCYSIADGLAIGLILYPIIKLLSGRGADVKWLMYVLSAVLLVYFLAVRSPY